ncbi:MULTISPECIES: DUF4747 family protein [unclassified Carboxylicivirga]|uniref:DUF4747 family protein n=1 Tax=Carboxylicivirga TaxID=1628153 RepID=UPI003D34C6EF
MTDELKYKFEVINIKLQTEKEGDDKKEAYIKLITDLVDNKVHSAVAENKHIMLYSYFRKKTEVTGVDYLYGRIGKGFYFDKKSGQAIDIENLKSETIENDTSKIFDASIAEFIFIPEAHRFCIQLGAKISGNDVRKFFMNSLLEVKEQNDIIRIELENEPKAIDEILTAKRIHKIDYVVTYTNDDVLSASADLFDKRLKKSQIGKIEIKAESDHNDFMNIKGEELLEGGIELARSNGAIKSATITTSENTRKTVKSADTPLRIEIKSTAEKFRGYMANLIMKTFRTESNDA